MIHSNALFGRTQLVHYNPDIFIVENFLTKDECERLLLKAARNMGPSPTTWGQDSQHPTRTSEQVHCPQRDAPTIVGKLKSLLQCTAEQLEVLQIIRCESVVHN